MNWVDYFNSISEELQKEQIYEAKEFPDIISYLDNPSLEIQLTAIEKDIQALNYIKL